MQEYFAVMTVPVPELLACHSKGAVRTISQKDGFFGCRNKNAAILQKISLNGFTVIKKKNFTIGEMLKLERLAINFPWLLNQLQAALLLECVECFPEERTKGYRVRERYMGTRQNRVGKQ